PLGIYVAPFSVTTGIIDGATNLFTNATFIATNLYMGYGVYSQDTNCFWTNSFNILTNWYDDGSNSLGSPVSNVTISGICYRRPYQPTNASYGVAFTNWIGVAACGARPTNRCNVCVSTAL